MQYFLVLLVLAAIQPVNGLQKGLNSNRLMALDLLRTVSRFSRLNYIRLLIKSKEGNNSQHVYLILQLLLLLSGNVECNPGPGFKQVGNLVCECWYSSWIRYDF